MATADPQDETRTTEAPHSTPEEHPGPNPPEEHLGLDDAGDRPAPDPSESPNLAEDNSIPGRSGEHPTSDRPKEYRSSNHSEERPESDLSKCIKELFCELENHQVKQLEITREIIKKITTKSQPPTPKPAPPTNPQPTIEVSHEIRKKIKDWNDRQNLRRNYVEIFDAFRCGIKNDSENKDLMTAIRMCITKIPDTPDISRDFFSGKFLHVALGESSSSLRIDSHESTDDTWTIINYSLNNFGCTSPQNNRDSNHRSTENDLIYGRIIHYLIGHHRLSIHQLCEIFQLFANFPTQHHEEQAQHYYEEARHYKEAAQYYHGEEALHRDNLHRRNLELGRQYERLPQYLQTHYNLARHYDDLARQQPELASQEKLAQKQEFGKLYSYIFKFVLGHTMEWKVLKWRTTDTGEFGTLQFNFRFFKIALGDQKSDIETTKWQPGRPPQLELFRESGHIPLPNGIGSTIKESRSSVLMIYGTRMDTPYWTIFKFSGQNSPRSDNEGAEDTGQNFLDGISHFRAWYSLLDMELQNCLLAWRKLLSEMDVGIGLKLDELCNPQTLGELMRDGNDSKRSKFYFVSFSMLRKFADCMEETLEDLEDCCEEVNSRLKEHDTSAEGKGKIQEISRQLLETHREQFQDLIHQIKRKINMVMPLQESLFNSTSIREASEATHQGRYIFVFTMMTIVYLPLGFVTSLFGMNNITENSPLATSMAPFAVTFSVVAAVTYIIACGSFPFANRTRFPSILGPIWNWFQFLWEKTENKMMKTRWDKRMTKLGRTNPNLHSESNVNQDFPNSSSRSHALRRFSSFFQQRAAQSPEASGDVENLGNPAAAVPATTQNAENATPRTNEYELRRMDGDREDAVGSTSVSG